MLREFFQKEPLEAKIDKNEKRIQELLEKVERMGRETDDLFEQMEVTPAQIESLLSQKEHFTDEAWEAVQAELEKSEAESAKRDVAKLRETYSQRAQVRPQWIFVR